MSAEIKLRVLAGANAGAELTLTEGEWVIGTDAEAELTFAEPALAPRQLRLGVGARGVTIAALAPGVALWDTPLNEAEERPLEDGVPVSIGATRFVLGDGPLRDPPPPPAPPVPAEPEPAEAPPAEANSAPPSPMPLSVPTRRKIPVLALAALLGCVVAAGGGAWWLATREPTPPTARIVPRAEMLDRANATIRRLDLAARVSARIDDTRLIVAGQVVDDAQLRALTDALKRVGISPEFAVITDTAVVELVSTILRAFRIEGSVAVIGRGHVRLEGYAPEDVRVDAAVRQMIIDVPGLDTVDNQVATPTRAANWLRAALRERELSGSLRVAAVHDNEVDVQGTVGPEDTEAWAEIRSEFAVRFPAPVRLSARITTVSPATVRGVSLGRSPFVLLENGQRLTIGDVYGSLGRIVRIEATGLKLRTDSGEVDLPYSRPPQWVMEEGDGPQR